MPPTPIRQRIRTFLSPKVADFLVAETADLTRMVIPEFGTPHPDAALCPHHKFCYAVAADDQGLIDTFLYAAPRENQDDYNWEHTEADIGGTKFDAVRRSYVIPRADFTPDTPAMGAANPDTPVGKFTGTHYLAEKKQIRIGDKELDSLFVVEERLYVKKVTLVNVSISPENGRAKAASSTWYYRGETVPGSGTTIEVLAANKNNAYWGQQSDAVGTFRELSSQSENYFIVTESTMVAGDGAANGTGNPAKSRTRSYPTPSVLDYIVRETGTDAANLAYGTAHYDSATYPNHKLSYKRPVEGSGGLLYEFFYTAPRANQDAYNARHAGNDVLVRTYVFPRASYPADLDSLTFGADDPQYGSRYGFTHEELVDVDQELHGVFVMIRRFYQQLVKERYFYDDELQCDVRETTELVEHDDDYDPPATVPGKQVELRPVNTFYDELVTLQVMAMDGDTTVDGAVVFPRQLTTIPRDVNHRFPDLLVNISLVSAYAFAANDTHRPAYAEDYYFDPIIKEAYPGPHEGRVLRFLTDDPDAFRNDYPLVQVIAQYDSIPLVAAWWASGPYGNVAFALADKEQIPPTIHGQIPINGIETLSIVQQKTVLPASPGYINFSQTAIFNVGYDPIQTRYGLWEVRVTQINASGIYGGRKSTFDDPTGTTGAGDPYINTTPAPVVYTAVMAADNSSISGTATPLASITAVLGTTPYGLVQSDINGAFTLPLNAPYFTDTQTFQVKARKNSQLSGPVLVQTFDLAPLAPTASINTARTIVSGLSEPGAAITITPAVTAKQKITNNVNVPTTITTAGLVEVIVFSELFPGGLELLYVPVAVSDTSAVVAEKVKVALNENTVVKADFIASRSSAALSLEARVAAENDSTLALTLNNSTSVGLTSSTSTIVTNGIGVVTTVADGSGVYAYTFGTALANGTVLTIVAADDGGVSPATNVTASSTPPVLTAAAFTLYAEIQGTVEVSGAPPGSGDIEVVAMLDGVIKGSPAPASPADGSFTITLPENYVRGESFQVIARETADITVTSAASVVQAIALNLPKPSYNYSETLAGYIGTAPAPADLPAGVVLPTGTTPKSLIVRYEPTAPAVEEFEIFASNNEFFFTLDEGGENGQRYAIYFRYEDALGNFLAYSDETFISSPQVTLPGAGIFMAPPPEFYNRPNWVEGGWPGTQHHTAASTPATGSVVDVIARSCSTVSYPSGGSVIHYPYDYLMAVVSPTFATGTMITIKFPGQDVADIGPETPDPVYYFGAVPSFPFIYRTNSQNYPSGVGWPTGLVPRNGWYQNAAYPTRSTVRAALPASLRIIVEAPDGRISETRYDRNASYPYNDPIYSSGL